MRHLGAYIRSAPGEEGSFVVSPRMAKNEIKTVAALEEALRFLADEKNLFLWRVNETPPEDKPERGKGWGFSQGHGRRGSWLAPTIAEAVMIQLALLHENLAKKIERSKLEMRGETEHLDQMEVLMKGGK